MIDLAGSRVVITGGGGFIGSTIADQLVDQGVDRIVVIDNFVRDAARTSTGHASRGSSNSTRGTSRDRHLLAEIMHGTDVVFHQAAIRITQCAEEPRLALEVMVDGTFNVIEAAADAERQQGRGCVVGVGLRDGRGVPDRPSATTATTIGPSTARRRSSTKACFAASTTCTASTTSALRYFNVYGPRMDIHGVYTEVLVRWMERIAAGQPPLILGDGHQTMDFVFVDDIARANILAATSSDAPTRSSTSPAAWRPACSNSPQTLLRVMGSDLAPSSVRNRRSTPSVDGSPTPIRARPTLGFEAEVDLASRTAAPARRVVGDGVRERRLTDERRSAINSRSSDPGSATRRPKPRPLPIASGWIAQGPNVAEFEEEFAARVGAPNAVALSNCTTALHLALIGAGIGPGDEVVVPSFSFIATTNAVLPRRRDTGLLRHRRRHPETLTAEPIQAVITPSTKAIIIVDQAGMPADIDATPSLCDRRGIVARRGRCVRDRLHATRVTSSATAHRSSPSRSTLASSSPQARAACSTVEDADIARPARASSANTG